MISAAMLCRSFDGVPAVENLSFEIPEGSLFALLGPNGAGKTTTVRLLLGLIAPDSGTARIAGHELGHDSNNALRSVCGLLTETPGFYDRISAWENLILFSQLYRIPQTARDQRLEHHLRLMNLWERRNAIRGSSTITQQLAKNLYLSPSRNPLRKVKEAVTAYRLEVVLGKRRILELYANLVELGPGIWGAEAASRHYYGRSASRLSRAQAAALAATLPFPLLSNPASRPGRMRWRQNLSLRRMRGEPVEVPRVEEPEAAPLPPAPAVDSLPRLELDSGLVD